MADGLPPQQGWRGGQGGLAGMPVLIPQFGVLPFSGGPVHVMPPGFPPLSGPGMCAHSLLAYLGCCMRWSESIFRQL